MKRSKILCYGLLLVSLTIFGLSLVDSSDVNATSHEFQALPLFSYYVSGNGTTLSYPLYIGYPIGYSSEISDIQDKTPLKFNVFYSQLSNNQCVYSSHSSVLVRDPRALNFYFNTFYDDYSGNYTTLKGSYQCNRLGKRYGENSFPSFQTSSLPADILNLSKYLPYYYPYSHFYLRDHYLDTSSGIHYNTSLRSSELFGVTPKHFNHLNLPLDINRDSVGDMTVGREFEIKGAFDFSDGTYFNFTSDALSNGYFRVRLYGEGSSINEQHEQVIDCTTNYRTVDDLSFKQLEYTCSGVSDFNYSRFYAFQLEIDGGDNEYSYIWDTDSDWRWAGLYIVTDNDDTPGAPANVTPTGNDLTSAPGSAQGLAETNPSDGDWFASLSNLFNFNLLNPFAPLFGLFINQDRCVNIPTLANMIHSNETTVCPWFDSNVRSIVTPVLGISSVMLLFGFVIRWLGSSSGNFFEDSSGETLTYSNWYGSGRGFRRTSSSASNKRINR